MTIYLKLVHISKQTKKLSHLSHTKPSLAQHVTCVSYFSDNGPRLLMTSAKA